MQKLLFRVSPGVVLGLVSGLLVACGGSSGSKAPSPSEPVVSSSRSVFSAGSSGSSEVLSSQAQVSSPAPASLPAASSVSASLLPASSSLASAAPTPPSSSSLMAISSVASNSSLAASSRSISSSLEAVSSQSTDSSQPPVSSTQSLSSSSAGVQSSSSAVSSALGLSARPANRTCFAPSAVDTGALSIQWPAAFPALPFLAEAVGLFQLVGDTDYWYALDQTGVINRFSNQADVSGYSKVLDIKDRVLAELGGEAGLLGAAVHPDFSRNRWVFLYYTGTGANAQLESRIARYKVNLDGSFDKASELVLLRISRPYSNHVGGQLAFGTDGYLYIASGDGGSGGDPHEHGQNKNVLLGKILRIDVNATNPGLNYAIPADNPFVGVGDARPEIWAYGLRNPWRFSFDPLNGDLWVGDVGQNQWEEINIVTRGANYGWGDMEGNGCYSDRPNCSTANKIKPLHAISHDTGVCSVIGGYVYRGVNFPSVYGKYFFTDYCVSNMSTLSIAEDNRISVVGHGNASAQIVSFAQDAKGELYAIGRGYVAGQQIIKLQVSGGMQPGVMADRLSATGCAKAAEAKIPAASLIPYKVSSALWSDGAEKDRYFALPDAGKIAVTDSGDFEFPRGSVLVKHFKFADKFIETRLFARGELGWQGFSYEWLDDQSDALLLSEGKDKTLGSLQWRFPARDQCLVCHTRAAGFTLGLEALQLNAEMTYPISGISANQLATLGHIGVFSNPVASPLPLKLAALNDESASLEARARSYLHSNCSGCHRPEGNAVGNLDLRFTVSLPDTHACNQKPTAGNLAMANPLIIAPGEPQRSVLLARMKVRGNEQMPPLASSVVDTAAVQVIGDWIASLQNCN